MRFASLYALVITTLLGATSAHAADPAFTLVIDTRLSASGNPHDTSFAIPVRYGYSYDCTIDWGDGTSMVFRNDVSPIHTYAAGGVYTVAITENTAGGFPTLYFNDSGDCLKVAELKNWGAVSWSTLNKAFYGCRNMVITATDEATARTGGVTDFEFAWSDCAGLTSFPLIDTHSAVSVQSAWTGCSSLTSFPVLDTHAVTTFTNAWRLCSSLTSFPLLDTAAGDGFGGTWSYCSSLTSFPPLDTAAANDFDSAWYGCSALQSFPLLATGNGWSFYGAWSYCASLTAFPAIDTGHATTLQYSWYDCSRLTSFPALDTSAVTDFTNAWQGCTGLTGFPAIDTAHGTTFAGTWAGDSAIVDFPVLDLHAMSDGTGCFTGVTLPLDTYDRMLVAIAGGSPAANVTFDAGAASRYTVATAHDQLTGGSGWTISDGGALPLITSPHYASVSVNAGFRYQVGMTSDLGTWSISGLPAWLTCDSATGVVEGTAPNTAGQASFTISATAFDGTSSDLTVTIDLIPGSALVLAIDTTRTDYGDDHQFTLPLHPGYVYDCTVAWGDGSSELVTSDASPTHFYAAPGYYRVAITENTPGGFPTIFFDRSGDTGKVLELCNWGTIHWQTLNGAFAGCRNLVITATDEAAALTGAVTDFTSAWQGCAALTGFPLIDTHAATSVASAWQGCSALSSFPQLDTSSVTSFAAAWQDCSSLVSFPPIATGSGQYFNSAWSGCSALTSFPALDTSAGTDFSWAWFSCSSLPSFPPLPTGNAQSFYATWSDCRALQAFPQLATSTVTTMAYAWNNCQSLTAFPLLDTASVTDLRVAWQQCSSLASFPLLDTHGVTTLLGSWENCRNLTDFPLIDTSAVSDFTGAWNQCTSLASFPLIDTSRGANFSMTWAGCHSLTSFPALDTSLGSMFFATWNDCPNLASFPLIDTSQGTDFDSAWSYCTALTSFPALAMGNGTDFNATWLYCFNLTSFPLIDTSQGTLFSRCWSDCSALQSFPALDTSHGTNFSDTWRACSSIRDFPFVDLHGMTVGSGCFYGVTLPLDTYDRMLVGISAVNNFSGIYFDAGAASRYTVTRAHDALDIDLYWTITDGGALPLITSPDHATAFTGTSFTYQVGITGGTATCVASGLPAWLSYDDATRMLSGTAPDATGQASFTITATALDGSISRVDVTVDIVANTAFTLVIDTAQTADGASDDHQFTLPLRSGFAYDCTVVWGDGTSDTLTSDASPTHTYATAGVYRVAIIERTPGGFPTICFLGGGDHGKVLELAHWGTNRWATLYGAFDGCGRMTITAEDSATAGTALVEDFAYAWYGCSALTSFPLLPTDHAANLTGTWAYCTSLTGFPLLATGSVADFTAAWSGCSSLTSFPALDTSYGISFSYSWAGCSALPSFPLLDTHTGQYFQAAWKDCSALSVFPLIDTGMGSDFSNAWQGCSQLTTFPALDTQRGTAFSSTWNGCSALTGFPLIDTGRAETLWGAWEGCQNLGEFPALDTARVSYFTGAWADCAKLTGFPLIDTSHGTDFSGAWTGCSGLTSFPALDTAHGTSFANAWGVCSGLTSFPLLDTAQGTDFSFAWAYCSGLTSFPALDTGRGTDFHMTWLNCSSLTSFPPLDTAQGTNFMWTWLDCYALTSFPAIDTARGTGFNGTWGACSAIQSFPFVDLHGMSDGAGCFQYVTLPLDTYDRMLTTIAAGSPAAGVTFDAGAESRYTTVLAHDALTTTHGWAIFDGGALPLITSPDHSTAFAGTAFSYQVALTGGTATCALSSLPGWLSYDATSRLVGGTAPDSVGSATFTITATALDGTTASTTVTVDVVANTAFTLVIDTGRSSPERQFTVPLHGGYAYDCTIFWGDGASSLVTAAADDTPTDPTHTYAVDGTYSVSVVANTVGGFPAIRFNGAPDGRKVLALRQWGDNHWISMDHAFTGCSAMSITAGDSATADTGAVTDFSGAWADCGSITSFPVLDTSAGTDFPAAWSNCSALTAFPVLDLHHGQDFSSAWNGCSSLASFPLVDVGAGTDFDSAWLNCHALTAFPRLDTRSATNLSRAWLSCSALTTFPAIDTHAVTNLSSAWAGCSGLTAFPLLDTAQVTIFHSTWYACSGLVSFPQLDTGAGTDFDATWAQCSGLTSFPVLTTSQGTEFSSTWENCSAIAFFPLIDLHNMINGPRCLRGVSLDVLTYDLLLHDLSFRATAHGVYFDAGETNRYTYTADHDHLTGTLGWTVIDAGSSPHLASAAFATATVGMPFSYHLAVDDSLGFTVGTLPAWLSYDSATGMISGTAPATVGQASFIVAAQGPDSYTALLTVTVFVNDSGAPVITASDTFYYEYAPTPASYQIVASNHPTLYGADGLPGGVTLDSHSGLITGTATDYVPGTRTYTVTLHASNAAGAAAKTIQLTVFISEAPEPVHDDTSNPSHCGLGGGVALFLLLGLGAVGRGARKPATAAPRR